MASGKLQMADCSGVVNIVMNRISVVSLIAMIFYFSYIFIYRTEKNVIIIKRTLFFIGSHLYCYKFILVINFRKTNSID